MKNIFIFLTSFAFIFYGTQCLVTNHLKLEFKRYGLEKFRILTGLLELLGGLGVLVGRNYNPILIFSSGGLALLMLLGTIVRLRIKDSFIQILPAFSLMIINAYICFLAFRNA